jgi:hypothetical protein
MSISGVLPVVVYDHPPDEFGDLWDYGVSESSQSLHPMGNPMSHSTHIGFNCPGVPVAVTASSKSLERLGSVYRFA